MFQHLLNGICIYQVETLLQNLHANNFFPHLPFLTQGPEGEVVEEENRDANSSLKDNASFNLMMGQSWSAEFLNKICISTIRMSLAQKT